MKILARLLPVLLLLLLPSPVPGQVPEAGLAIVEIRVEIEPHWLGPTTRADGGEPTDGQIKVHVENRASQPSPAYTLRYFWSKGGMEVPLNADEAKSLDAGESLPVEGSRTHTLNWILREGQAGAGEIVVRLQASSAIQARKGYFVEAHDVAAQVVGGDQDVGLDGTAFWRVVLVNAGNVPETFAVSFGP